MVVLKGITWEHDRGRAPMLATAAEFTLLRPDVRIEWDARSLSEFGEYPLQSLFERYDLIVLDHPFVGNAAAGGFLVPLDKYLSLEAMKGLEKHSVGPSYSSYTYEGHQWALPIDAAAQVSGYRPDLLEKASTTVPKTWEEVFELGRIRPGFVAVPLCPIDAMATFLTLCANLGEDPFSNDDGPVVSVAVGQSALQRLRTLADISPPEVLGWNPIELWERMAATDDIAYCPLAFGYSNYARPGYRKEKVLFTNIPSHPTRGPRGSLLGGAGLAVSANCKNLALALEYGQWVAGAKCQRTLYFQSGGQPANKLAWIDPEVNKASSGFFESTLLTLEQAYLRPRVRGFVEFQTAASHLITDFLLGNKGEYTTLRALDEAFALYCLN